MKTQFVAVAPLTYTGPDGGEFTYTAEAVTVGQLVRVPFGRRSSLGVVTAVDVAKPSFATKPITEALEVAPLPLHLVKLAAWLQHYYFASAKAVWQTLLPTGVEKHRRAPKESTVAKMTAQDQVLSAEQTAAAELVRSSNKPVLIEGITGSGKTRVYLELATETLAAGKSVILLLPEIALTPQLIGLFEAHFAGRVIAAHSKLTEAQRHLAWQQALESKKPLVVVGARSALFLPLAQPGLIVVDECHEAGYKQEQNPRYDTVTVAAELARLTDAKLVLGSATPRLTERWLAEQGRLELARMTTRPTGQAPAAATIVDLRERDLMTKSKFISQPVIEAIGNALQSGEQALLFLNRRGSASSQMCDDCGHVTTCPHCHMPLTFHADRMELICHLCGHHAMPAAVCPECGSAALRYLGGGTKRIETEVARLFPDARIGRIDADSQAGIDPTATYEQLRGDSIDIIIGTQMIAKGLDLPRLTTAAVINADGLLHLPDYTAAERTVQLLMQVAGRVGRRDTPGVVFIQTRTPDHPAIQAAASGNYAEFAAAELKERQSMGYPPFRYLLKLSYRHKNEAKVQAAALDLQRSLNGQPGIALLGPAPAFHERAGGTYTWHLAVKAANRKRLLEIAAKVPSDWGTDLDPANLL